MKSLSKWLLSAVCGMTCVSTFANLENFDEPNTAHLLEAIQTRNLHVVQLGDSHTAADLLTDSLRTALSQRLGSGGMGWGMPMYIPGQRLTKYGYENIGWQPLSSRTQHNGNYTLGGMLAVPKFSGASLTIKAKQDEPTQTILASIRQGGNDQPLLGTDANGRKFQIAAPVLNGTWQMVEFNAKFPITVKAQNNTQTAIGGWWAKNQNSQGAIVSALGINGAELGQWERWNDRGWKSELAQVKPNLIILAYGTNEAYNANVDITSEKQILEKTISALRSASPKTSILILSAPESLKNTSGSCGTRPIQLTAFQAMQKQVANEQNTLFWDWQKAMGGSCSMKGWISQGLARGDGVHFSANGYQRLGQQLAQDLLSLSPNSATAHAPVSDTPLTTTKITTTISNKHTGKATICSPEDQSCLSL